MESQPNFWLNYYGNLGIQLRPIQWKHWSCWVNTIWNLSLNLLVIYALGIFDPYGIKSRTVENLSYVAPTYKPTLRLLIALQYNFNFVFVFTVNVIYLYLNGPKIAKLLSAKQLSQVHYPLSSYVLIAMISGLHLMIGYPLILNFVKQPSLAKFLPIIGTHVNLVHYMFIWHLIHFLQYSTCHHLANIRITLSTSETWDLAKLIGQIRELAKINTQFRCLLSLPMLTILYSNILSIILSIVTILTLRPIKFYNLHILFIFRVGFWICLNVSNDRILDSLRDILNQITHAQHQKSIPHQLKNTSNPVRLLYLENLYGLHFTFGFFQLFSLGKQFLSKVALLVLSLVVLVLQTDDLNW